MQGFSSGLACRLAAGALVVGTLFGNSAFAQISVNNLNETDLDEIIRALSSNSVHMSNTGPAGYGRIFGFEVGLVAGVTQTPGLDTVAKKTNSANSITSLPNAAVVAGLTLPLGFTFEATYTPKITSNNVNYQANSFALNLKMNDLIPVLPIQAALRGIYGTSDFSFSQTVASVTQDISNRNQVSGVQLMLSPTVPVVETYVGVGALSASNRLSSSVSTIFLPAVTTDLSFSRTVTSTHLFAGLGFNFGFVRIGAEAGSAFNNTRYSLKLTAGF